MKMEIKLEQGKMKESEVREAIERASATARKIAEQKGEGVRGHEQMRDSMIKNAEKDSREGKI
jgi:hypothetical protein